MYFLKKKPTFIKKVFKKQKQSYTFQPYQKHFLQEYCKKKDYVEAKFNT